MWRYIPENLNFNIRLREKLKSHTITVWHTVHITLLFGRFPGFALLSFWQKQRIEEDGYGALIEWYGQGKPEVLGGKLVPAPICPPHISRGLIWDRSRGAIHEVQPNRPVIQNFICSLTENTIRFHYDCVIQFRKMTALTLRGHHLHVLIIYCPHYLWTSDTPEQGKW